MPSNTIYAPINVNSLEAPKLKRYDDCVIGQPTLNATTNFDLVMSDDVIILGGEIIVSGATIGDYLRFQVVDKDNVMGYGANVVLDTFINKRGVASVFYQSTIASRFPAKIKTGLYLRVVYVSVGTTGTVDLIINYDLTRVLV